jgi:hypothetical protein
MDECKEYKLLTEKRNHSIHLTENGEKLLLQHRKEGVRAFNLSVFKLMEDTHKAFRTLIEFLYKANPKVSGALVFPHYSPLELNFNRKNIQTTNDMMRYMQSLVIKLQLDIEHYLKINVDLSEVNRELLVKITRDRLLEESPSAQFVIVASAITLECPIISVDQKIIEFVGNGERKIPKVLN